MDPTSMTISPARLAELLGLSEEKFLRQRRKLEKSEGLPRNLPGGNYYLPSVAGWMKRYSERNAEPVVTADSGIHLSQRAALDALYGERH